MTNELSIQSAKTVSTQYRMVIDKSQPRSQGPLSTSRKDPGCGWSRVC